MIYMNNLMKSLIVMLFLLVTSKALSCEGLQNAMSTAQASIAVWTGNGGYGSIDNITSFYNPISGAVGGAVHYSGHNPPGAYYDTMATYACANALPDLPQFGNSGPPNCSANRSGSIINIDQQTLSESIPVAGTPFDLTYITSRDGASKIDNRTQIPITQSWIDGDATKIHLEVTYDGQTDKIDFEPSEDYIVYTYTWDGKDRSGQIHDAPMHFAFRITETPAVNIPEWRGYYMVWLGGHNAAGVGLGGWLITPHHYYNPNLNKLYRGDGTSSSVEYEILGSGDLRVVDPRDSTLHIFNPQGVHLESRTYLLNSLVYSFAYDSNGYLDSITDAHSNVTSIQRDSSGLPLSITSPYGQVTYLTLNGHNKLVEVENPENETFEMTYHSLGMGLLASFKMPGAQVSEFSYDSMGGLTLNSRDQGPLTEILSVGTFADRSVTATTKEGRQTVYEMHAHNTLYTYMNERSFVDLQGREQYYYETQSGFENRVGQMTTKKTTTVDARFPKARMPLQQVISSQTQSMTTNYSLTSNHTGNDPFSFTTLTKNSSNSFGTSSSVYSTSTDQ
jgi:YD repeat-containing protein